MKCRTFVHQLFIFHFKFDPTTSSNFVTFFLVNHTLHLSLFTKCQKILKIIFKLRQNDKAENANCKKNQLNTFLLLFCKFIETWQVTARASWYHDMRYTYARPSKISTHFSLGSKVCRKAHFVMEKTCMGVVVQDIVSNWLHLKSGGKKSEKKCFFLRARKRIIASLLISLPPSLSPLFPSLPLFLFLSLLMHTHTHTPS